MTKRAIIRTTIFLDASLKAQVDAIAVPRPRTKIQACLCGASQWRACKPNLRNPSQDSYICGYCGRRRRCSRVLASVTSATDGGGVADRMIAEYFAAPRALVLHELATPARIGLFIPRELHVQAKRMAKEHGTSLSCLLASIIAAKVRPVKKKAA